MCRHPKGPRGKPPWAEGFRFSRIAPFPTKGVRRAGLPRIDPREDR
jgi:hypothetical protein